jgi:hypothetical protein
MGTSSTSRTSGSTGSATGTMSGTGAQRFDDYRDTYRSDWEHRFGQNKPWNEHEDAFRYGWHAGQHDRYQGRDFDAASSDLERDYPNRSQYYGDDYQPSGHYNQQSSRNRGQNPVERGWNDFKDTVREGFDRARMEFNRHS